MARQEREIRIMNVTDSSGTTAIALTTPTAAVYTKAVYVGDAVSADIGYKIDRSAVTSSASATLVMEISHQLPDVEYSASPLYAIPVGMSAAVITMITTNWSYLPMFSSAALKMNPKYVRFLIQGKGTNSESIVTVNINKQVEG